MSTLFGDPESAALPLRGMQDLISAFSGGEKPSGRHGVGIEYERLPVHRETGQAVPYSAPAPSRGRPHATIATFLSGMVARGWNAQREGGPIVALERGGTRVTLEPGAQVELSGRIHTSLKEAAAEVDAFVAEADEVAAPLGIAFLGLGMQPFTPTGSIGWVPKRRYGIMAPYLAARGHLAHHMMKATAGCQINLDFSSEQDAMEMLRVATGISTLVTAICGHSPLEAGQANGFVTKRSHVWMHTDPDRCGLLRFVFDPEARYETYAGYALDVPMMFVVRDGTWVEMKGMTFRRFMAGGSQGLVATRADWQLHLTTLFPEVRLKSYLEVRGSDSGSPAMTLAQAALWKGLLYDRSARAAAWDLVRKPSFEQRLVFQRDVARRGLGAAFDGRPALDLARELLGAAARGLPGGEASFLEPMQRLVDSGVSPALRLMAQWSGPWQRRPWRLVEGLDDIDRLSGRG